ncbi:hypothetical protein EBQ24_03490 [Allofranklinella schreckenbergeri]|uniref:Mor transcription activator domain-containing protein n=1 Tax=Allofranklinella schreckenbergeri TaxID=1076744 RepID=A0A3M6R732_9BURK|nr:Mor transcription activator family protein [Allofranklinella schreckenbergeri]RMX10680.1 hypothetical protein EBQ24_03490 [Allofranklinella schreckenbergeri]
MSKVVHTLRGRDERARDEMLEALRHEVAQALQGHGIAQESAEHIAQSAVEHVIRIVAGQTIYFPSAYASYVTERAQAIAAEFRAISIEIAT